MLEKAGLEKPAASPAVRCQDDAGCTENTGENGLEGLQGENGRLYAYLLFQRKLVAVRNEMHCTK